MRADPIPLAAPAAEVAIQSGPRVSRRVGQTLAGALETTASSREELDAISKAIPWSTTALADVALIVAVRRLGLLRPTQEPARAWEVMQEAIVRLGNAGRWEEAMTVARIAFQYIQDQAKRQPGYRPFLVTALADLTKVLADGYGQEAEALKFITLALEIFDSLPEQEREVLRPVRADLMTKRCASLWRTGDWPAAVTAGKIALSELSDLPNPDPIEREADLATTRHWYTMALSSDGKLEEALRQIDQAVASRQKLAGQQRDTFLPDYARSLEAQSEILEKIAGVKPMAVGSITDVIGYFTELARDYPSFRPELAQALQNRALIFFALGQANNARPDGEAAVDILRPLARLEPSAYMRPLANCLILSVNGSEDLAVVAERLLLARHLARECNAAKTSARAEALLRGVDAANPAAVREARARLTDAAVQSWLNEDGPDGPRP